MSLILFYDLDSIHFGSSYYLYILILFILVSVINSTRCSLASGSNCNLIDSSFHSIILIPFIPVPVFTPRDARSQAAHI